MEADSKVGLKMSLVYFISKRKMIVIQLVFTIAVRLHSDQCSILVTVFIGRTTVRLKRSGKMTVTNSEMRCQELEL